jgi:uncharacterized protein YceK
MRVVLLFVVFILSGCGSITGGPTPTPDPIAGEVTLVSPPQGSVIYASTVYVSGSLAGIDRKSLLVRLMKPDGGVIAQARIEATEGEWGAEIIHGYTGEPTPVTVEVVPAIAAEAGVLAQSQILFGVLSERPEGAFINILTPQDGVEVGGDTVQIMGTASGIEGNTLLVELIGDSGEVIESETIVLMSRYAIDETPWTAALTPGEYRGNAVLQVTGGEVIERLTVLVGESAG